MTEEESYEFWRHLRFREPKRNAQGDGVSRMSGKTLNVQVQSSSLKAASRELPELAAVDRDEPEDSASLMDPRIAEHKPLKRKKYTMAKRANTRRGSTETVTLK